MQDVGSARPGTGEGFGRRRAARRCRGRRRAPAGSAGTRVGRGSQHGGRTATGSEQRPRCCTHRPARRAAAAPQRRPGLGRAMAPGRPPPGPAAPPAGSGPRGLLRRLRLAAVAASALVLVLNGTAWGLYRDVTAGITTTDVIAGGSGGGRAGHPARRRRQPHRRAGQPAAAGGAGAAAHRRRHPACSTPTRSSCCTCRRAAAAAVAFSIPRDSYVDIPGYRRDKINAAYPAVKALTAERLVGEGVRDRARIDAESAKAGRTALIGAVERLTGVTVDHYAEINLLGFYNLTSADRRRRRVPEGRRSTSRCPAPASPPARRRSPVPTRSRSSASATACPRATCRGSAASRCSWPRSPTRSSPAAR